MKKAVVLGIVLALVLSVSICAAGTENQDASKAYKHIPGLMALEFSDLDTDGDDRISLEEFGSRFPTSGEASFKVLDKDSSSGLDRGEWNAFKVMHTGMGSHHGNHRGQERFAPSAYNAHFGDMDSNGDGVVDPKEFDNHFTALENNQEVFKVVDLNQDSQLDHDEWHAFKKAHKLGHN